MHKSILTVATIAAALTLWGCGGREETSPAPDVGNVVEDAADTAKDAIDEAEDDVDEATD